MPFSVVDIYKITRSHILHVVKAGQVRREIVLKIEIFWLGNHVALDVNQLFSNSVATDTRVNK
jgi:hypothetical protein